MKNYFLLSWAASLYLIFSSGTGLSAEHLPSPFKILPQPQQVILLNGQGLEYEMLHNLVLNGTFKPPVMGKILSQLTIGKSTGKGTLTLVLNKTLTALPSEEGYVLTVTGDAVEIISTGEAGLFYGCQSLEQLLEDANDYNMPIPACKITDYPVLAYRAVHFDVKHHLDHMNYYYESIDRLAQRPA